jgi:voltage-gated potassium channel
VIWLVFVAEVVTMLAVVPNRKVWARTHALDLAIVVLTPPVMPATLQAARVFRLARLRLARGFVAMRVLFSPNGVRYAAMTTSFLVLIGGASFAAVEKHQHLSAWDGFYWAVTTVTTVGYGDIQPKTDAGRVIAMCVMAAGIGFVAILTGRHRRTVPGRQPRGAQRGTAAPGRGRRAPRQGGPARRLTRRKAAALVNHA